MFPSSSHASSAPLAGWETGATPHLAPWQRLDATWPILPESLANGLDGPAQRLIRQSLSEAVGVRLSLLRTMSPESRRLWETRPHLAQYVRQRRYFENLLPRYSLAEFQRLSFTEVALTVELLETPPKRLGVEEWGAVLELQCQRIGQLYTHLCARLGTRAAAQQEVRRLFQRLPGMHTTGVGV